ncbi:MAG: type II toxin-antitoxin system PemK/MazF family toxin [Bacteroidetes bacterium]|nr:type II toxin-antitoxin system PemK/MazF family toxin [Bacteroidota bacterium]MBU1720501.1 type II toxin-antitoxin system PemK/MazF family toxin [Bacteroidota bacterium]
MKQNFQKGEIVNVDLGKPPKEVKGHEQGMDRPCVVIKSFSHLELAVVTPCTSKEPTYSHYTIVKIAKGSGGLVADSYALCHQIRTVSFDRITSKRGKLDNKDLLKVQTVLLDALEL